VRRWPSTPSPLRDAAVLALLVALTYAHGTTRCSRRCSPASPRCGGRGDPAVRPDRRSPCSGQPLALRRGSFRNDRTWQRDRPHRAVRHRRRARRPVDPGPARSGSGSVRGPRDRGSARRGVVLGLAATVAAAGLRRATARWACRRPTDCGSSPSALHCDDDDRPCRPGVGASTVGATWFGGAVHGPRTTDEVAITFDSGPAGPVGHGDP
jgi:hypothetical protein